MNDLFDIDDPEFLSELEALLDDPGAHRTSQAGWTESGDQNAPDDVAAHLYAFLAGPSGIPLDETTFVALAPVELADRTNLLLDTARKAGRGHPEALQAVESFVVFFQALLPTIEEEAAPGVRAVFFRLVPALLHIAFHDFSPHAQDRPAGRDALKQLEAVLLEISNVRLTPGERQLVIRSLDQMTELIGAGDYALASELLSARLLKIIQKNKLTRALFRLMEVEATVQVYLKGLLGCATPEIRVPEDLGSLHAYGPVRVLEDENDDGRRRRFIQVQVPDIPILRDVVLKLVSEDGSVLDLRMDALGTAPLQVPEGKYALGLAYQPANGAW